MKKICPKGKQMFSGRGVDGWKGAVIVGVASGTLDHPWN